MSFFCLVSNSAFYPTGITNLNLIKYMLRGRDLPEKSMPEKLVMLIATAHTPLSNVNHH